MEIRLIGRPEILDDTGSVRPVRGHQSWALLARILMTQTPLSRRTLSVELFDSADDPLGALRWSLAALRRAFASREVLVGDPVVATLPVGTLVDVDELLAGRFDLARADALLEGIDPRCSPEFDTWLMVQRHRVAGRIDEMLHNEVIHQLSMGDAALAVDLATVAVQRNVYDEGAHVLLIKSLVRIGSHEAAAAHVRTTTDLFNDQLGRPPTPALRDAARPRLADPPPGVSTRAVVASLLESGLAALAAGAPEAGVELLRRASQESERAGDKHLAASCLYELGSALVHAVRSHDEEGAALLQQGVVLASEVGEHLIGAKALRELGYVEARAGRRPAADRHLEEALVLAGNDLDLLAGVHSVRAFNLGEWGRFEEAINEYSLALDLARYTGGTRRQAWTLGMGAWVHLAAEDHGEARVWTQTCLALIEATRWVAFRPWPVAVLAETELASGAVTSATRASLEEAFALSCRLGDPCWEGTTARMISLVHAADGQSEQARSWIDQALLRSQQSSATYASMLAPILATAAELSADAGDEVNSANHARALISLAARAHLDPYLARGVALLDHCRRAEQPGS